MGEDASVRQRPTADEMAEMKRLVAEATQQGAIGLGASYSLNHSGHGGVPMPSTISDLGEFDALVGAMGEPGGGVVEISSGPEPSPRWRKLPPGTVGGFSWAPRWRSTTSSTRSDHQAVFTRHVDRPPHQLHPGQFGNRAAQQRRA
jgi:hypothetical protein